MKLFGYDDESVDVDVDLDDPSVLAASMLVLSGDEVLSVMYQDGSERVYDSSDIMRTYRLPSGYCDDSYVIVINGKWLVDKDSFLSRKDSYWRDDDD